MASGNRHNLIRRFPYTSVALALALLVLGAAMFWHIDVFEGLRVDIDGKQTETEIGDIIIPFLLVIPAFILDRVVARRRAREAQLQAGQLRVLRVTIRTLQDIVNDSLSQLQLLRLQAKGHVPDDTLELFNQSIQDAAAQLTALANMEAFAENPKTRRSPLDVWLRG